MIVLSGRYDPAVLKKLQGFELEILRDFIRVCEENNLVYFGFAGTGIGALRHGGFIPWDDDIDLAMPRDDYRKAMEVFERDLADKYTVVHAGKYKDFPVMNTHIILNDSTFITTEDKRGSYPQGIFLDIFPVDHTPADEAKRARHLRKCWLLSKILILKHIPFPHLPFRGWKAKIAHCVTAVAWFFLNLFCISHNFLYERCLRACTAYNDTDTGVYAYCCGTVLGGCVFDKEKTFPLRKEKFEDTEICFPQNLEETLTALYGDFMRVPPPEKQINHCPDVLIFPGESDK